MRLFFGDLLESNSADTTGRMPNRYFARLCRVDMLFERDSIVYIRWIAGSHPLVAKRYKNKNDIIAFAGLVV